MFQACKQLRTNCIIETEASISDMEKKIVTEMATVEAGGKGGQARIKNFMYTSNCQSTKLYFVKSKL